MANKLGRGKRSPARARYKNENRQEKNARIKLEKHLKKMKIKEENPPKIPHGTSRSIKRQSKQRTIN